MEDARRSIGRRENEPQSEFWVATRDWPRSPGHPFYQQLNQLFAARTHFCGGLLLLEPLNAGEHVIHFSMRIERGSFARSKHDVTYLLTVLEE